MNGPFRYRVNWRGKLILQISVVFDSYIMRGVTVDRRRWRDAKPEDITERVQP